VNPSLDPPDPSLDAQGMIARVRGIPGQIEAALEQIDRTPWRPPIGSPDLLAVGAMGGSAISAELCADLYADRLPRPMLTVRDYAWPACVGPGSLVLLSSYSGNTEETLALHAGAEKRGVPCVALTTGGELGRRAAAAGLSTMPMPPGSPPRAAMFASWVSVSALLHALGWIDDPRPSWRRAVSRLRTGEGQLGVGVPETENPAKRLARAIAGRPVLIYAGGRTLGAVATRIRQQLNENAKVSGHSALVPELNHNEIVSWERPGVALRGAAVLILHDLEDAPGIRTRLELTADYVRHQGADVHDLRTGGGERLERLAGLIQFGDYLSLYLAFLGGVDPTPIASIDAFKERLAARGTAG
jgi:glucose/mannose-6-phosphate isomerase